MPHKPHDKYAGKKPKDKPGGVRGKVKCAYCDKMFDTIEAAAMHERSYHKKRLQTMSRTRPPRHTGDPSAAEMEGKR
jgi:hypothetical protein